MSRLGTLGARLYRGEVSYEFVEKRKSRTLARQDNASQRLHSLTDGAETQARNSEGVAGGNRDGRVRVRRG